MPRRPRRVRIEHHTDDPVYWSRVAERHARRAVYHARRAEVRAGRAAWQSALAAGLMAAGLVVFAIVQALD